MPSPKSNKLLRRNVIVLSFTTFSIECCLLIKSNQADDLAYTNITSDDGVLAHWGRNRIWTRFYKALLCNGKRTHIYWQLQIFQMAYHGATCKPNISIVFTHGFWLRCPGRIQKLCQRQLRDSIWQNFEKIAHIDIQGRVPPRTFIGYAHLKHAQVFIVLRFDICLLSGMDSLPHPRSARSRTSFQFTRWPFDSCQRLLAQWLRKNHDLGYYNKTQFWFPLAVKVLRLIRVIRDTRISTGMARNRRDSQRIVDD